MGAKGKRRREKNYRAAHGGPARLPPPPKPSQVEALPTKLRKIMSFASSAEEETRKRSVDGTRKTSQRENESRSKPIVSKDGDPTTSRNRDSDEEIVQKNGSSEKQKRKRKRKQVTDLRFETAIEGGSKRREKKRRYFEAKKEKQKKAKTKEDLDLHEKEKIKFGEVVEAPPKLISVPKPFKTAHDASKERIRLQAIEAYRERKGWNSRPGGIQFPTSALS